jgi:nucleoside-diphosphate-sugar epimerase
MILVTGATGFLGAHVLLELVRNNLPVKALYRDIAKIASVQRIFGYYHQDLSLLMNKIEWIEGDINDYCRLCEVLEGTRQVYHIAAKVSIGKGHLKEYYYANVKGTANVVNACLEKGMEKLCYVSSIATIGELAGPEQNQEDVLQTPDGEASAYAMSKFLGELEVWRGIQEGLNAVIVNPSVIIGPGMWMGQNEGLFYSIYRGLKFYPTGTTGYVDVRDVAAVMFKLMESTISGQRFIVNAENIFNRKFLSYLAMAMNRPEPVIGITPLLQDMAIVFEMARAFITGHPPRINRIMLRIASEHLSYSGEKLRNILYYNFISVEQSVKFSAQKYLSEMVAI